MDTKLFFAIISFDLVWIAKVKFAALAFATMLEYDCTIVGVKWRMIKSLRQECKYLVVESFEPPR